MVYFYLGFTIDLHSSSHLQHNFLFVRYDCYFLFVSCKLMLFKILKKSSFLFSFSHFTIWSITISYKYYVYELSSDSVYYKDV